MGWGKSGHLPHAIRIATWGPGKGRGEGTDFRVPTHSPRSWAPRRRRIAFASGQHTLRQSRQPSLPATPFVGVQGAEPPRAVPQGVRPPLGPGSGAGGPGNAPPRRGKCPHAVRSRGESAHRPNAVQKHQAARRVQETPPAQGEKPHTQCDQKRAPGCSPREGSVVFRSRGRDFQPPLPEFRSPSSGFRPSTPDLSSFDVGPLNCGAEPFGSDAGPLTCDVEPLSSDAGVQTCDAEPIELRCRTFEVRCRTSKPRRRTFEVLKETSEVGRGTSEGPLLFRMMMAVKPGNY